MSSENELDEIYTLLSYSLVFRNWQPATIPFEQRRGYNIGCVLVNPDMEPVHAGLNSVNSTNDATRHGELVAITEYISATKCVHLRGFTLYVTLEPCIMCAGMIIMTQVERVVYGQHDVDYSKAFDRLAFDSTSMGGFRPYPRPVKAQAADLPYCQQLDDLYQSWIESGEEKILAKFLASSQAEHIYRNAHESLMNFAVEYEENKPLFQKAINLLNTFKYDPVR